MNGEQGLQIVDQLVRGTIDSDESAWERTPRLQIDGRPVSWEAFGQMLLSFEGWQFKLEIIDPSDDA